MNGKKVRELAEKLEVFYLANKTKNIHYCILGDCTSNAKETDEKDEEIKKTGILEIERLNEKYPVDGMPIFGFIYRKRVWNEKEKCYMGWERKRGLLTELNNYLLNSKRNELNKNEKRSTFIVNTFDSFKYRKENKYLDIKYVITIDNDTNLCLNSGIELIEAMAHPLNKPMIDEEKKVVKKGYGIIQPRIGIDLETSYKTGFTQIFAGERWSRFIYKCNFRYISR